MDIQAIKNKLKSDLAYLEDKHSKILELLEKHPSAKLNSFEKRVRLMKFRYQSMIDELNSTTDSSGEEELQND